MKKTLLPRAALAALALAPLAAPALALQYPLAHFGGLTLDVPLAVAGGGLGNATGDGSSLTVAAPGGSAAGSLSARAGHNPNVIDDFGAKGTATSQAFSVTTTAGSTVIDFAAAGSGAAPAFTSALVGTPIEIAGAGAAGAALSTTVVAVHSASELVVAAPAGASLSAAAKSVMIGYDDTAALQAAFTASASTPVTLPCGVYRITAPLSLPQGGYVVGRMNRPYYWLPGQTAVAGPCVSIVPDGFSGVWWSGSTKGAVVLGGYAHLEGVGVNFQNGSAATVAAIYANLPFNEIVHNYTYGGGYGIWIDYNGATPAGLGTGSQGQTIRDNEVTQAQSHCLYMNSTFDFDISHNWLHGCTGFALNLNSSGIGTVVSNIIEDSTGGGVRVVGNSVVAIVGNKFDGNYGAAISVQNLTQPLTVTGNFFHANANNGGSANWEFSGTNTGAVIASGNTYISGAGTQYQAKVYAGATVAPGTAFYEFWPSQVAGLYYDSFSRATLQPMIENSPNNLPGPYANDAAAATAGVPVGAEYFDASGVRRKRIG